MKAKAFYWIPRVLTIIAILFMAMFSFDVFDSNETLIRKMEGFIIHNIPALLLTAVLILAWKKELAGGILFIVLFFIAGFYFKSFNGNPQSLIVITPFLLTGILFIFHYLMYGKNRKAGSQRL